MEGFNEDVANTEKTAYWGNVSEVEARNVERRSNMTADEIRKELASQTEGMSRERQITISNAFTNFNSTVGSVDLGATSKEAPATEVEKLARLFETLRGMGINRVSATDKGNLLDSEHNMLMRSLADYVVSRASAAQKAGKAYRISDFMTEISGGEFGFRMGIDLTTASLVFGDAGVSISGGASNVAKNSIKDSLMAAGVPEAIAQRLSEGNALFNYASEKQIGVKKCS